MPLFLQDEPRRFYQAEIQYQSIRTEESAQSLEDNVTRQNKHGRSLQPDVWRAFVDGDETCFKDLFRKYHGEMYGYGFKLCNQPEMVKDCIQELFKTIWEKRNELSRIKSPNVYLFVSLRRMILKNLKKQKRFQKDLQEVDESDFLSFGIEEVIITDETKRQQSEILLKALNQLSARQKEVVWLFFYNGMSYGEIEKILSINRQSVCNLMYRSMETLRKLLKNREIMNCL